MILSSSQNCSSIKIDSFYNLPITPPGFKMMDPRMKLRAFLSLFAAIFLCCCDGSSSSGSDQGQVIPPTEAQLSLQAFVDSLSQVPSERGFLDRKAGVPDGAVTTQSNLIFEYSPFPDSSILRDETRLYRLPGDTTTIRFDTVFSLSRDAWTSWKVFYSPANEPSKRSGISLDGETRAGFRFGWRELSNSDIRRLRLDSAACFNGWTGSKPVIYSFGSGWEIPVPLQSTILGDSLPLFHNEKLVGWLIWNSGSMRPLIYFPRYSVFDLDGRSYSRSLLQPPQPRKGWLGDSLGLFFGKPIIDTASGEAVIPYSWRFLQGTAKVFHRSKKPFLGYSYSYVGCGTQTELQADINNDFLPTDSGSAISHWSGFPNCADTGNRSFHVYFRADPDDSTATRVELHASVKF